MFHVIAPDYPGFGNSDTPDPAKHAYTFDKLSEVVEAFLAAKVAPGVMKTVGLQVEMQDGGAWGGLKQWRMSSLSPTVLSSRGPLDADLGGSGL